MRINSEPNAKETKGEIRNSGEIVRNEVKKRIGICACIYVCMCVCGGGGRRVRIEMDAGEKR